VYLGVLLLPLLQVLQVCWELWAQWGHSEATRFCSKPQQQLLQLQQQVVHPQC
jgi:hypothetical protein